MYTCCIRSVVCTSEYFPFYLIFRNSVVCPPIVQPSEQHGSCLCILTFILFIFLCNIGHKCTVRI